MSSLRRGLVMLVANAFVGILLLTLGYWFIPNFGRWSIFVLVFGMAINNFIIIRSFMRKSNQNGRSL
jgi:hypothetical protein